MTTHDVMLPPPACDSILDGARHVVLYTDRQCSAGDKINFWASKNGIDIMPHEIIKCHAIVTKSIALSPVKYAAFFDLKEDSSDDS